MESNYLYHRELRALWDSAVNTYRNGERDAAKLCNEQQQAFLDAIGATPQEVFDFAEDFVTGGEPDYDTFALLADRRRSYFLQVQQGRRSERVVANEELPPKDAEIRGIVWLPRIIRKAKAKLQGEMNPDLMYCCGGDRKFLREHNLHPAEFLALVERNFDNDDAVIDFIANRNPAEIH